MEALFQPVPFGEVRESVLEKISTPDNAPIWDMFRTIDPDKQHKVLLVSTILICRFVWCITSISFDIYTCLRGALQNSPAVIRLPDVLDQIMPLDRLM